MERKRPTCVASQWDIAMIDPLLPSVRQSKQTLGQLIAQLLVATTQQDRELHQDVMLAVELVVRKSVAPFHLLSS